MTTEEINRLSEIQGFADAIEHNSNPVTGITFQPMDATNPNETRFSTFVSHESRNTYGTLIWSTSILAQTGAHIIKALVMIFRKLDHMEYLLQQQEIRQRNKES
jgi:hypothetical protein